jgi:hypothetical protein
MGGALRVESVYGRIVRESRGEGKAKIVGVCLEME